MSNQITIVGNLTREPEIRYTSTSRAVCNLGVASSRRYQVNNEWTEETTFFNLTLWGSLGENVAASLHKGDRIVATGRMQTRDYEVEGVKKTAWDVIVDELGPSLRWARCDLEKIKSTTSTAEPASSQPSTPPAPLRSVPTGGDPVFGPDPEEPF